MVFLENFGIHQGGGKDYENVIYSLALLYNTFHSEISEYLQQYQLSVGKFNILIVIKNHGQKEGISQVEISKHLIVTPSNMTKMIDKLEREKLVTRSALKSDRRVNIIQVTDKAKRLLEDLWEGYDEILKNFMKQLSLKDQRILSELLPRWAEKVKG